MKEKELLQQMTLGEKAELLTGKDTWHVKNCPRLGVPATMVSDGPHGLRKQNEKGDNLGIYNSIEATCFPSAAGMASSFNRDLLYRLGETLGKQCQAEQISILLGPGVNIKRSPLCGRNFEYFSEDPLVAGELAAAYINGVQKQGVGTSMKHFACNNQEYRRMLTSSVVDQRALRELYLPAFEIAVKKAQPWTIMASYNKINGVFATENPQLLTQILRREWGFQGYVVTDWGASYDRVKGVKVGCDLEMPARERNTDKLMDALQKGLLKEEEVETCADRILHTSKRYLKNQKKVQTDRQADHETARVMAREAMVLLKNDNHILPLTKEKKVAFIGAFAETPRYQGGGSSHIHTDHVVSALQAAQGQYQVTFAKGYEPMEEEPNEALIRRAAETARDADIAVVFVGLTDRIESEGYDRCDLNLPKAHNRLVASVAAVQPNTVVVLHSGAPVLMPWLNSVKAVLNAYLGGEAVGEAVVDLLYGVANPSGKLAETFPKALEDTPCYNYFPGNPLTSEYRESVYVGYRYYDKAEKEVLFPFGYGLSYTEFTYSDLKIKKEKGDCTYTVTCRVKNTGAFDGAEVVQLYIAPPAEDAFRPAQELRGFEKVFLKAGEAQTVTFSLDRRSFAYYHIEKEDWAVSDGLYQVRIGASSRDIRLCDTLTLTTKTPVPFPYTAQAYPSYATAEIQAVPNAEFERLLGTMLPSSHRLPGTLLTLDDCLEDARDTAAGKALIALLNKAAGPQWAGMVQAVTTCPLRGMIGFFGDQPTRREIEALLDLLNNRRVTASLYTLGKWMVGLLYRLIGKA